MHPGRSVLVTGSSTGIGRTAALRLDRDGWRVFAGVRREADGTRLAAEASGRLQWLLLDVTDGTQIRDAVRRVEDAVGAAGLQGLVNNAGIAVGGPLEYVPTEQMRRQFEVNVFGLLSVTQQLIPALRTGRGRIVNIGSVSGRTTTPLVGPYCASKHAVEALTTGLRLELAPWKIHAAVIEPGMVVTPIWDKGDRDLRAAEAGFPPQALEHYGDGLEVMRRLFGRAKRAGLAPETVADAIVHALSARRPRNRYLLGRDARIRVLLQQLLPGRWYDALVLRALRRVGAPSR